MEQNMRSVTRHVYTEHMTCRDVLRRVMTQHEMKPSAYRKSCPSVCLISETKEHISILFGSGSLNKALSG